LLALRAGVGVWSVEERGRGECVREYMVKRAHARSGSTPGLPHPLVTADVC
jgi:hypothetical protein